MELYLIIGILALGVLNLILLFLILGRGKRSAAQNQMKTDFDQLREEIGRSQREQRSELTESVNSAMSNMANVLSRAQETAAQNQNERLKTYDDNMGKKQILIQQNLQSSLKNLEERFRTFEASNEQKLEQIRATVEQRLTKIQEDNQKQLGEIRTTVDEKLQKTLDEKLAGSFQMVSERLEQVYKGLGEMQTIAQGVGDLKKVLSNVKTRGILGEIQLGAILSEILTADQYDTDVATVKGSTERVEFAVKLPAEGDGGFIYLPIDSKFPGDTYYALQQAYEAGDPEQIKAATHALEVVIKKCAKDIHDKYICPPDTTNFAILFLPFEGLYAEVVRGGMVETLQRDYQINIAGPSTMAAMLNSLQMGFRTLQIQKQSDEVWKILGAVKSEFEKFDGVFASAMNRIRQLEGDMDKLVGARSRAIIRTLKGVESGSPDDHAVRLIDAAANDIAIDAAEG